MTPGTRKSKSVSLYSSTESSISRTTTSTASKTSSSSTAVAALIHNPPRPVVRTLADVRSQVASEIAIRAIAKATTVDGVRVGLAVATSATPTDEPFFRTVSEIIHTSLALTKHIFIIAATVPVHSPVAQLSPSLGGHSRHRDTSNAGNLIITASHLSLLTRAVLLTGAKFTSRLLLCTPPLSYYISLHTSAVTPTSASSRPEIDLDGQSHANPDEPTEWFSLIADLNSSESDAAALYDILQKAAHRPMLPLTAPGGTMSITERLSQIRAKLQRLSPRDAFTELRGMMPSTSSRQQIYPGPESHSDSKPALELGLVDPPKVLVDIRSEREKSEQGRIGGALEIDRNELEWKLDPRSSKRLPSIAERYDMRVIVFCRDGDASSLAVHSLQELGLLNATDIIGGFRAWRAAKLPIILKPVKQRSLASLAGSLV